MCDQIHRGQRLAYGRPSWNVLRRCSSSPDLRGKFALLISFDDSFNDWTSFNLRTIPCDQTVYGIDWLNLYLYVVYESGGTLISILINYYCCCCYQKYNCAWYRAVLRWMRNFFFFKKICLNNDVGKIIW